MAFTLTQLDALDRAIASGTLTVSYDGKSTTYRSTDDLIKARNLIRSELVAAGAVPAANRGPSTLAVFGRD